VGRRRCALARPSVYVRKRYRACRDPAAAHARQLKELAIWIVQVRWWLEKISPAGPESFRGRDLTKVAQYEVLGNEAKKQVRPVRDDRNGRLWVSRARLSDCQHSSIVPFLLRRPDYGGQAGTDCSLKTLTQHFVLGYFH
jgi:hypothetical protein